MISFRAGRQKNGREKKQKKVHGVNDTVQQVAMNENDRRREKK